VLICDLLAKKINELPISGPYASEENGLEIPFKNFLYRFYLSPLYFRDLPIL
jgi:hypothetical protein